jgi:hypothetical protein
MRGRQEAHSTENIDRADVLVVRQGGFRRVRNPLFYCHLVMRMHVTTPLILNVPSKK